MGSWRLAWHELNRGTSEAEGSRGARAAAWGALCKGSDCLDPICVFFLAPQMRRYRRGYPASKTITLCQRNCLDRTRTRSGRSSNSMVRPHTAFFTELINGGITQQYGPIVGDDNAHIPRGTITPQNEVLVLSGQPVTKRCHKQRQNNGVCFCFVTRSAALEPTSATPCETLIGLLMTPLRL